MNSFAIFNAHCGAAGLCAVFITGLFAGSFFNVCIYRLPLDQDIVFSRSRCPCCRAVLGFWDLLPVAGYLLRRGKCRYCAGPISERYPLVELLSAFLFLWCYAHFSFSVHFFKAVILTSFLLVIAFIDIDHRLILDKVLIWLGAGGILTNIWGGHGDWANFFCAAALGGGFLYLIFLTTGGKMGLGDVKLTCALGLWLGVKLTVLTLFFAFCSGGVTGMALILAGRKSRKDFMPFAPFIAAGAFLSLLYGDKIIDWYLAIAGIR